MADNGTLLFKNIDENIYPDVFWIADYESDVRFLKFNMADPTWRTSESYFSRILMKSNTSAAAILDPPCWILKMWRLIRNQRPKKPLVNIFINFLENLLLASAILDPPCWILKIWYQIRNQRARKPPSTRFHDHWIITKMYASKG